MSELREINEIGGLKEGLELMIGAFGGVGAEFLQNFIAKQLMICDEVEKIDEELMEWDICYQPLFHS